MTRATVYRQLQRANDECYEWIRASAIDARAARIVKIGSQRCSTAASPTLTPCNTSTHWLPPQHGGADQPRDYVKTPNKLNPLIHLMLRRHPNFVAASRRKVTYVQCRARLYTPAGARRPHLGAGSRAQAAGSTQSATTPTSCSMVYDMGRRMQRSGGTTSPHSSKTRNSKRSAARNKVDADTHKNNMPQIKPQHLWPVLHSAVFFLATACCWSRGYCLPRPTTCASLPALSTVMPSCAW